MSFASSTQGKTTLNNSEMTAGLVQRCGGDGVDDRPDNNTYERDAFESVGITFTLARSTAEALQVLGKDRFAAIISDMGRAEGPTVT